MNFDEWLEKHLPMATGTEATIVKAVWEAATLAEREACAKACEALYDDDSGPACDDHPTAYQAADAIRMRSNGS